MISFLSKDNFPFPENDFNLISLSISLFLSIFALSQLFYDIFEYDSKVEIKTDKVAIKLRAFIETVIRAIRFGISALLLQEYFLLIFLVEIVWKWIFFFLTKNLPAGLIPLFSSINGF